MTGIIVVLTLVCLTLFVLWWLACGREKAMNESVERLSREVEEGTSAVDSAVVFMNGLANRLREALLDGDDGALATQISELADQLDANSNRLASAIAANTLAEDDSDVVDSAGLDSADLDGDDDDEADEPTGDEPVGFDTDVQPNPLPDAAADTGSAGDGTESGATTGTDAERDPAA